MFYRAEYIVMGKCWVLVGAYLGICFDVIYLGGSPPDVNKMGSIKKAILRMIVCGILATPYILMNKMLKLNHWPNSYPFEALLKESMPIFFTMLIGFSYLRIVLEKLGLVNSAKICRERGSIK